MLYTAQTLSEAELTTPTFLDTDKHIRSASRNVVYGPPNNYKTWFVLEKVLDILDQDGSDERVLYCMGEGSFFFNRERFNSLIHGKHEDGFWLKDYGDRLVITNDSFDLSPPVVNGKIEAPADLAKLVSLIDKFKPTLLVLDPVVSCYTGDENSSKEYRRFTHDVLDALILEKGVAILLVHHTAKTNAANPGLDMRGSTVLRGWVDCAIEVKKEKAKGRFRARVTKMRDGEIPDTVQAYNLEQTDHGLYLRRVEATDNGETEANDPMVTLMMKARHVIKKQEGKPFTKGDLRELAHLSGTEVNKVLARLKDTGQVVDHSWDDYSAGKTPVVRVGYMPIKAVQ